MHAALSLMLKLERLLLLHMHAVLSLALKLEKLLLLQGALHNALAA
jgi:hypothetical protein